VNRFVIADPKRCIGCYTCMAACVGKHQSLGLQAHPRLFVTHTHAGTMPIQCRHCEDSACITVCPVKAITRKDGSVQLNESICIGCKMCGLACPFGAITFYGTPVPTHETNVNQYAFVNAPYWPGPYYQDSSTEKAHPILEWTIGQKTVAIKCDLCSSSPTGPECVRVCPTRALRIIDERVLGDSTLGKRNQTVADVAKGRL
jgi:hydrogenase-4 component A